MHSLKKEVIQSYASKTGSGAIIPPTLITKILLNMIKHGSVEISEADYPVGSKKQQTVQKCVLG